MKSAKQLVVTILIACASLCLISEASFAAPNVFKFVIRGGRNVGVQLKPVNQNTVDLIVVFQAGNRPAGNGLSAGQGSWTDRGMRRGEPTRLIYRTGLAKAEKIKASLQHPDGKWTFWCSNTGNDYLNATGDIPTSTPNF